MSGGRQVKSIMVSFAIQEPNGLFLISSRIVGFIIRTDSTARDKVDTQESQQTTPDEFRCTFSGHRLEVTVQDRTTDDDGDRKQDELGRDHLRGVEALQSSVDVANLHQGTENEDEDQQVGNGECDDMPQRE